ncbi:hypothetical protein PMZ93_16015, partial [Escherichia coli]|nr:hypothetical protein [Escherichia coli]
AREVGNLLLTDSLLAETNRHLNQLNEESHLQVVIPPESESQSRSSFHLYICMPNGIPPPFSPIFCCDRRSFA